MTATILFLFGLSLALLTLRDVIDTVVVPGRTGGLLSVLRRIIRLSLPLWRAARRREQGVSTSFAPFALVQAFVVWMLLLTFGFGLMVHALASSFEPALPSFGQALFVAGSGLVTVGLSETDATGLARWVVMSSGFFGLAVVTLAVTYLLQVQGATSSRDAGILKLTTSAGRPPSGLALLERYAEIELLDDVPKLLKDARDWCAELLQSHASHPSLVYFRSKETASGWPAALGALMDLALICDCLVDRRDWRGPAKLLGEEGGRTAQVLVEMIGLKHADLPPDPGTLDGLLDRLASAGLPLRSDMDLAAFAVARGRHAGCVRRLADHLGSLDAPLVAAGLTRRQG